MGRWGAKRAGFPIVVLTVLTVAAPAPVRAAGSGTWAISHGGPAADLAHGVAVAPDGATFVGGRFSDRASFGGKTFTSAGASDFFVAAYDAAHAHLWSFRGGGPGVDWVQDVARLPSGEVVAVGSFDTRARIGSRLYGGQRRQLFIARVAAGRVVWAVDHGGAKDEIVNAVATDAAGNIYITGTMTGPASLGSRTLPHEGGTDLFVAKYDGDDGRHIWSKAFGSTGNDVGAGIAVAESGDVLVTGRISGTVPFGEQTLTAPVPTAFAMRLSGENGTHRWARTLPATGASNGVSIAVDKAGDAVATGYFNGSTTLGAAAQSSSGSRDVFIVKLAGLTGETVWSHTAGGRGSDVPLDVAVDVAGDVFTIGSFVGSATVGGASVASTGGLDLFLSLIDGATGAPVWASARGSRVNDRANSLVLDANGNPIVAGFVGGATSFGTGAAVATQGGKDAFIAAFAGDDGKPVSAITTAANSVLINVPMVQTSLVSGTATDDRIGILRVDVTFTLPGAGVVLGTAQATMECTEEMRKCTWTVAPPVNPGPMVVTAVSTDRANNVESPGASVTVVNI